MKPPFLSPFLLPLIIISSVPLTIGTESVGFLVLVPTRFLVIITQDEQEDFGEEKTPRAVSARGKERVF